MARNIACKDPDHPLEDVIDEIADLLDQQAHAVRACMAWKGSLQGGTCDGIVRMTPVPLCDKCGSVHDVPKGEPQQPAGEEADRTLRTMWCKNCGDVYVNYACACCSEPILAPKPDEAPAAAEDHECSAENSDLRDYGHWYCNECGKQTFPEPAAEPSGEGEGCPKCGGDGGGHDGVPPCHVCHGTGDATRDQLLHYVMLSEERQNREQAEEAERDRLYAAAFYVAVGRLPAQGDPRRSEGREVNHG